VTNALEQVLIAYERWLLRQPLVKNTHDASRFHIHQYGRYLANRPATGEDHLYDPFAGDYPVRKFNRYLNIERKGKQLSSHAIDVVLPQPGTDADLELSAQQTAKGNSHADFLHYPSHLPTLDWSHR
jgi:hypothetical protein